MRRKQKLPPMLLFTINAELFDWFGWGDWLYVFASLLSFVQSFFIFLPIDEDTNFAFNFFGMSNTHIDAFITQVLLI